MDQSDRYADLSLKEADLIKEGKHVLVAYIMKPKPGFGGYLETAAHFAAESSTGTNVAVSTTDDFTRGVDALVYEIDPAKELMKIAYPVELFDRNITDGRAMICSFLTLAIGNNQGMGDVDMPRCMIFTCRRISCVCLTARPPQSATCGGFCAARWSMAALLSAPLSSRSWACARSLLPMPAMTSGAAAISSRMMNRRATSCLRR